MGTVKRDTDPGGKSASLDALVVALQSLDVPALRGVLENLLDTAVVGLLLYGSRARSEQTKDSDWDLLAVTRDERPDGVRRSWNGVDLDIDTRTLDAVTASTGEDLFYMVPSRILWDSGHVLSALVKRIEERREERPTPMREAERDRSSAWVQRMLARLTTNLEANPTLAAYQMSWLHEELLVLYFRWRTQWTMSPRNALGWLQAHDAATYEAHTAFATASDLNQRAAALRRIAGRTLSTLAP